MVRQRGWRAWTQTVVGWVRRWRAARTPADARRRARARATDDLGRRGERAAVRALRREGYRVLAKRWKTPGGEVDVVAMDGETVVLVEVKASRGDVAAALGRVDARKRRRLAAAWRSLAARPGLAGRPWRLDVVAVGRADGRTTCQIRRGFARLSGAAAAGDRRRERGLPGPE